MITHPVEQIWENEPDSDSFTFTRADLDCRLLRNPEMLTWCGYVRIPDDHPHAGSLWTDADRFYDVHGGLTWKGPLPQWNEPGNLWFGFDCAHAGDYLPGMTELFMRLQQLDSAKAPSMEALMAEEARLPAYLKPVYRTFEYARQELKNLASQVYEYALHPSPLPKYLSLRS